LFLLLSWWSAPQEGTMYAALLGLLLFLMRTCITWWEMRTLKKALHVSVDETPEEMNSLLLTLDQFQTVNESFHILVAKSKEQVRKPIYYEKLPKLIEEIVDIWYNTLKDLKFLRVCLQSESG